MTECKDKTLDLLQVFQNTINTQEDIGIAENLIKSFLSPCKIMIFYQ